MDGNSSRVDVFSTPTKLMIAVMALVLLLGPTALIAQNATGSLSGTVLDASGAVVPKATVTMTNELSQTRRQTVSNNSGYFNIAAVPPGSYTVFIEAQGFAKWETKNLRFNQGENHAIPNIQLRPGSEGTLVEVVATPDQAPLETGESRETLNGTMVSQISIQGRDAAELMKIMPGMSINSGLGQSQWSSLTTGTNSGPVGNYSASGTPPSGALSLTTDGANIVDSGNQGTQISNINQDQTAEVTILNSAYGAEYAKGPVTFQAISKSGGNTYHGSGYLYTRNGALNAFDWQMKNNHLSNPTDSTTSKPSDSYYYPGFTFGGPVLIPGTNFNKHRDKLFFFTGYEYMKQQPVGTLHQLVVPTAAMMSGDFSGVSTFTGDASRVPCSDPTAWNYGGFCNTSGIVGGKIPSNYIDPNAIALAKLFPQANQDPASNNGYNYHFTDNAPVNRWEFRVKGDYNISQNNKLSATYTHQSETGINNICVWWCPPDTLPYPTQLKAPIVSNVYSANFTSIITPTMTNELVGAYSYFTFPPKLANAAAVDPAKVGFTAKTPFSPSMVPQIPNLISWGCYNGCFPGFYAPGFTSGFQGGAFGTLKQSPSISDNLSKVLGTHTLKVGGYWDLGRNEQTAGYGGWGQGAYEFDSWGNNSSGNPIADFLMGHAQSFTQVSALPLHDMRYHQYSFYGQDQWKTTRRLTLTYGLRFDHEGQWYAENSPGLAVWDPAKYDNSPSAAPLTGITWHAKDSSVPLSGFKSPTFYYAPRVGVAYDIFGTGKTVLRGGFGWYRWQLSNNDVGSAFDVPVGVQSITTPALTSFTNAANYTPSVSTGGQNGNVTALQKGDDRTPYTQNWDFIVSQQIPWKSTLELQYTGNRTRNALIGGTLSNINQVPLGAYFKPDPITGAPANPSNATEAHYRPYQNYQELKVVSHGSYSNYNAFIASWRKQSGRVTFVTNYTFSKVLGIRDGQTNNGNGNGTLVNPFNLRANYGPLAYDRTHIFNAAYVVTLPSPIKGNAFLAGAVNGWQISGITQFQSGTPIQPNTNANLNMSVSGVSSSTLLGTPAVRLMPILTCDPRSNLASGQYFNPSCFAAPTQIGVNGPSVWPYIKGPAYVNSDLATYKTFKITERQNVEFRLSMFNFLNHPLSQFGIVNDTNLSLTSAGPTATNTGTGFTKQKVGRRVMELAIKYTF